MTTDSRDTAIRDAKRYIRDIVRNDWEFEPASGGPGSGPPAFTAKRTVSEWRLREFDSSGSELEPASSPSIESTSQAEGSDLDYDSDELPLPGGDDRRRKRRRQMIEEMGWNEGLRTWVEMRDAWTGAQTRRQIRAKGKKRKSTAGESSGNGGGEAQGDSVSESSSKPEGQNLATRTEASLSIADKAANEDHQQTTSEREEGQSTAADQLDEEAKGKVSTETAITEPDLAAKPSESTNSSSAYNFLEDIEDPLVPVVPSLISTTNPIRAAIGPSMYPSIYSKVVVQALTPTVPINLADVTKAMVQGWKADGQWPPKPAASNIVLQDDATIPKRDEASTVAHGHERKKSGVASAVRKVLNFSGFHQHPFHRRGSSHGSNNNHNDNAGEGAAPSSPPRSGH